MSQSTVVRRIADVDALRGFALFGILLVNITFAASGYPINLVDDPAHNTWLDQVVHWLSSTFVDMKFYLLFSFLFGYSFQLQIEAAQRAGASFRPRMLRRLGGLFVLGWINMIFLISGDILSVYALIGLILLALRGVKDRTALLIAGGIYVYLLLALGASALFLDTSQFVDPEGALVAAQETTANLAGSWGSVIQEHLNTLPIYSLSIATVQGPTTLAVMLLGLVAGRRRLLANITGREAVLPMIQLVGFTVGITGGAIYASLGGNGDTGAVLASVMTAPFLAAAYVATMLRFMHTPRGEGLNRFLAPAGRMALTNYLGQSVATLLIFTGAGFGLIGELSALETFVVAVAIFGVQVALSHLWMNRFGYGPVEGVHRALTNAAPVTWRKRV